MEGQGNLLKHPLYQPLELTEDDIQKGLKELAKEHFIIQREGMPPRDQKFVVLKPNHAFTPVSMATWDKNGSALKHTSITPDRNWHDQWQPAPIVPVQPAATISTTHSSGSNPVPAIKYHNKLFKPIVDNTRIDAVVGISGLANYVLPSLIPAATKAEVDNQTGVMLKGYNLTTKCLPGAAGTGVNEIPYHAFNISLLTPAQMEQLFAHSLVDWVISNTHVPPTNFGIDVKDNVMAFDKGEAFKYFNGSKVQSKLAQTGHGIEAELNRKLPEFNQLNEDPATRVHALLRSKLRSKDIKINFDAPIIKETIQCIKNLTPEDIKGYLSNYAKLDFPGQEQAFLDSVHQRCQGIVGVVESLRMDTDVVGGYTRYECRSVIGGTSIISYYYFFKPIANNTHVVAEIGISGLANYILPSLIPSARGMERRQQKGVVLEYNSNKCFRCLPGAIGTDVYEIPNQAFNIKLLTSAQVEQLFAHSLVDWVISNTDVLPSHFGIDTGNVMAVGKGQSFEYFNGSKVQSKFVQNGNEAKLNRERPEFDQLEEYPASHVYALLRSKLRSKDIKINFDAPIIKDTIYRIQNLTQENIKEYLGKYAELAFPGQEQAFFDSVHHRCQGIIRVVGSLRYAITPYGS